MGWIVYTFQRSRNGISSDQTFHGRRKYTRFKKGNPGLNKVYKDIIGCGTLRGKPSPSPYLRSRAL